MRRLLSQPIFPANHPAGGAVKNPINAGGVKNNSDDSVAVIPSPAWVSCAITTTPNPMTENTPAKIRIVVVITGQNWRVKKCSIWTNGVSLRFSTYQNINIERAKKAR